MADLHFLKFALCNDEVLHCFRRIWVLAQDNFDGQRMGGAEEGSGSLTVNHHLGPRWFEEVLAIAGLSPFSLEGIFQCTVSGIPQLCGVFQLEQLCLWEPL